MLFGLCVVFASFPGIVYRGFIRSSIWSYGGIYIRIPVNGSTLNTSPCLVLALKIPYPIVTIKTPI